MNLKKFFFFFQAEDGIRDYKVTGVQTCALPILPSGLNATSVTAGEPGARLAAEAGPARTVTTMTEMRTRRLASAMGRQHGSGRSAQSATFLSDHQRSAVASPRAVTTVRSE